MKHFWLYLTILLGATLSQGQTTTDPSPCAPGQVWYNTISHTYKVCPVAATVVPLVAPTGVILPSGMIAIILSGTCPIGFSEATALNGKMLRGTLAANADVGTTGGNATITPAGTVSAPTFTGSSATTSATSAGTPAGTNGTTTTGSTAITATATAAIVVTAGSGSNVAAQTHTHPTHTHTVPAETFTGSAMATHTHTVTATGTNSAPTFTGTPVDPSPSYVKVIFCAAN